LKVIFIQLSTISEKVFFWKAPALRPFVLPVRAICRWRWWNDTDRRKPRILSPCNSVHPKSHIH